MPLGAVRVEDVLRVVKALGAHRYVSSRLHLVHAFALAAMPEAGAELGVLAAARDWAAQVLGDASIDASSRDERLWRPCTEAEVAAVLAGYWSAGPARDESRAALGDLLEGHGLEVPLHLPFDEAAEEGIHPILVDVGWELLALTRLDAERHRGAIAAFGEPIAFESARFEEETAIPPPTHICELGALGPVELIDGADDDGELSEPLVVWADGNETYLDYVVRGVRRAAGLPERDEP
jgi:hypothetical protein